MSLFLPGGISFRSYLILVPKGIARFRKALLKELARVVREALDG